VQNDEVDNPNRPVSVVEATAMSLNTAYADLWHRVALTDGQNSVVNMAKAFGVDVASDASGLVKMEGEAGTRSARPRSPVEEQANMIATLAERRRVPHPARHQADHRQQRRHPGQDRPARGAHAG
jgi:membrane peptidoglycan carboxypeptidase